jgi:GMP synthase PP-ATPase subunit
MVAWASKTYQNSAGRETASFRWRRDRIIDEAKGANRVVYDLTSKPRGIEWE